MRKTRRKSKTTRLLQLTRRKRRAETCRKLSDLLLNIWLQTHREITDYQLAVSSPSEKLF